MTTLVTALYAEGRSDERFLPRIIQRTAADLLGQHSQRVVDVLEPTLLRPDESGSRADSILSVARKAAGYHILFVHADADAPTRHRAYAERIEPGLREIALVREQERVCSDLVPVIPIQAVEAWLLADGDALREVIGSDLSLHDLGVPQAVTAIEGLTNPKQTLQEIVSRALANRPRRRRHLNLGELYEPLANQVSLSRLAQLTAFSHFTDDLTKTLASLGFYAPAVSA